MFKKIHERNLNEETHVVRSDNRSQSFLRGSVLHPNVTRFSGHSSAHQENQPKGSNNFG